MNKPIYFDHNATTPVHPKVLGAMLPYYKEYYGNASSLHSIGREARAAVDNARDIIGAALGTESVDIIFTSGGTESDNLAIRGAVLKNREKGNHIITSSIEHPAVYYTCKALEKDGFEVTYLKVDKYGMVSSEDVRDAVTEKTILITVMQANNEVGTIQPISEIGKIAKTKGIIFHTDAVQAFCKVPVNVEELGVDLLSLSAHKIYGPKGAGALYIRKGVKIAPVQTGGHHERKLRGGTENVAGIVGFAKAVELAQTVSASGVKDFEKRMEKVRTLRDRLHKGLEERIEKLHLNGHPTERLPGTLNIGFEFIEGESIMLNFDIKGICVSTGSACTSGSLEPSHVLMAMGIDHALAQGAIRFSLGEENTGEEIDYCLETIPPIIKKLRDMSPLAG